MQEELIGIEDFANCCNFCLSPDNILTATCVLHDADSGKVYRFEKSADLTPAIEYVSRQLAAWHLEQHGEDPTVAGWTDYVKKAVSTVKKVAQNKTVKNLYAQVKPYLKSAVKDLPGGETAMELATKAAKVYQQAKKGVGEAVKKVEQVKKMAEAGDSKAKFAVKVMQNVGTLVNEKLAGNPNPVLPQVAAAIQQQDRARGASLYSLGVTCVSGESPTEYNEVWNPTYDIVGADAFQKLRAAKKKQAHLNRLKKQGFPGMGPPPARRAFGATKKSPWSAQARAVAPFARPGSAAAVEAPGVAAPLAAQMTQPDFAPQPTTPDLPSDQYGEEELFEEYYEDEGMYDEDCEEEVAGWMYQRGYRSVPQALVQSQKSPGLGLAVREVYNRGLGRPATDLSQMLNAAIAEF